MNEHWGAASTPSCLYWSVKQYTHPPDRKEDKHTSLLTFRSLEQIELQSYLLALGSCWDKLLLNAITRLEAQESSFKYTE